MDLVPYPYKTDASTGSFTFTVPLVRRDIDSTLATMSLNLIVAIPTEHLHFGPSQHTLRPSTLATRNLDIRF